MIDFVVYLLAAKLLLKLALTFFGILLLVAIAIALACK